MSSDGMEESYRIHIEIGRDGREKKIEMGRYRERGERERDVLHTITMRSLAWT